jgi:sirohydrochlorin ferrochelatase
MEIFGILLLGNGSSLPYKKRLVEETANIIRQKHKITVYTALGMENGSKKTIIKHGNNTIEIIYARPFGIDPVVGELAYQRAREALEENKNETIYLSLKNMYTYDPINSSYISKFFH